MQEVRYWVLLLLPASMHAKRLHRCSFKLHQV
jgi:hypothetical protein